MTLHHRLYTRRLQAWLSLQEAFPAHSQAPQGCSRGIPAALQGRWAGSSMCSSPQPGICRAAAPPRGSPTHCRWLPGTAPMGYVPMSCSHGSGRLCKPPLRAPKTLLPPGMTPRLLGRKMLHQRATGRQMQVQNCLAASLKVLLCRAVHHS